MTVELECDLCGHRHEMGNRVFDENMKRMICPECGGRPFTVDRGDVTWHPNSDG
ncbi:MAG: hypothetical protein ABEI98_10645 [Halorhabdus sp.]